LFSVANTRLFRATFVQSFGFWFVTDGAKGVWIVFWVGFVTINIDAFASVVLAASGRKICFVNELLAFSANVSLVESTALSKSSDIFASGFTVVITAAWHASIVIIVPLVANWELFVFVDASIWWWNTFFSWTSTSSLVFDEFDSTSDHTWWIWDEQWAMFFTFTSVNFATFFVVDVSTFIEFFFSATDWDWSVFFWEHHTAFVWVSFIDTSSWISAFPTDTTISPVSDVVVFMRFTSWSRVTPGSLVKANSLFIVVHVEVVSREAEPLIVKRVIIVNKFLSIIPLVTVTSFTVIRTVPETVST
jgi:hypothetical protein